MEVKNLKDGAARQGLKANKNKHGKNLKIKTNKKQERGQHKERKERRRGVVGLEGMILHLRVCFLIWRFLALSSFFYLKKILFPSPDQIAALAPLLLALFLGQLATPFQLLRLCLLLDGRGPPLQPGKDGVIHARQNGLRVPSRPQKKEKRKEVEEGKN